MYRTVYSSSRASGRQISPSPNNVLAEVVFGASTFRTSHSVIDTQDFLEAYCEVEKAMEAFLTLSKLVYRHNAGSGCK